MARLGAAARNDLGAQRTEPGAPAGRPRAGRPGGNRMGLAATRMGTLPRADGWAAGYLLAQPGPAVRPGHRSSHGRRTAPLCGTAGAGGSAPRREAARLPARLRRGLAAPESGDAAREPARRQAGRRPIQQSLARQRPHGGVRQDGCAACGQLVQRLQSSGAEFDLYMVGSRQDDARIRDWAKRAQIDRRACAPAASRSTTTAAAGCHWACPAICPPPCAK